MKLRRELRPAVLGKDCFILGSGPDPDLSLFRPEMVVIGTNGSPASAYHQGLPAPTITVVDCELLDPSVYSVKESRKLIVESGMLSGLKVGHLIAAQSNLATPSNPAALGANYLSFRMLNRLTCALVSMKECGSTRVGRTRLGYISTGAFAIALCAYLNCRSITISGFSLIREKGSRQTPYFYGEIFSSDDKMNFPAVSGSAEIDSRSHSLADSFLISSLCIRGISITTMDRDILPLTRNWGLDGVDW